MWGKSGGKDWGNGGDGGRGGEQPDDCYNQALLDRLEELFKGSRAGRERWTEVCKGFGKGLDPSKHDLSFVRSFFDMLEAEGWTLPPMAEGVGPGHRPLLRPSRGKGGTETDFSAPTVVSKFASGATPTAPGRGKGSYGKSAQDKGGKGKGNIGPYKGYKGVQTNDVQVSETVYVGGIPTSANTDDVHEFFSAYGDVVEVDLKVLHATGQHRGFGFVTFSSIASAQDAIDSTESNILQGQQMFVKAADPSRMHQNRLPKEMVTWSESDITEKVFIGSLPLNTSEPEVKAFCEQYGPTTDVTLKFNSDGTFRGFGFVTFDSVESAVIFLATPEHIVIGGQPAQVSPARPDSRPDAPRRHNKAGLPPSAQVPITTSIIRVTGLNGQSKQRDVFRLFYNFTILRIRDLGGDNCYIEFSSIPEAQSAYRAKEGASMGGAWLRLKDATQAEFDEAAKHFNVQPLSIEDGDKGGVAKGGGKCVVPKGGAKGERPGGSKGESENGKGGCKGRKAQAWWNGGCSKGGKDYGGW